MFVSSLQYTFKDAANNNDKDSLIKFADPKDEGRRRLCNKLWHRGALLCFTALFLLIVLTFIVFPLIFISVPQIQRNLIFQPNIAIPKLFHQQFQLGRSNADCKETPKNYYVTVNKSDHSHIGVWHIQPYFRHNCDDAVHIPLNETSYPVILYFHSGHGDRRYFLDNYFELRLFFHVITFDYRGYGDSSWSKLNEELLVNDSVQLYTWLCNQTTADIYIWGDKLGAAIATHTVSLLKNETTYPMGLILEDPFTALTDLIKEWYWPLADILSWTPWYNATITNSLKRNKLGFETIEYIKNINCPIMILNWPNSKFPNTLGEKLAFTASERNPSIQGTVTYNLVPRYYTHRDRYSKIIPQYIQDFIMECDAFKNNRFLSL